MKKAKRVICVFAALSIISVAVIPACAASPSAFSPFSVIGSIYAGIIRKINSRCDELPDEAAPLRKGWTAVDEDISTDSPDIEISAETWRANEIELTSSDTYANPFDDVQVDLILTGNGKKYTIPGFWDGASSWKVRFACPEEGIWYFVTRCSDSGNNGLNGITGKVTCSAYSGDKDIYKHGFVTTEYSKKYFTYADGTPFFYLGDTHWSLGDETTDMVKTISAKRAEQGFTVWQSEPIGAKFDCTDGITEADIEGFHDYDEKFRTIADAGIVHANSQFFFPSYMQGLLDRYGGGVMTENAEQYLEKLTRYWVARYSAYPVMWTLGQEVDDDFYADGDENLKWNSETNPYKTVAKLIDKYDPYVHPLTAHQEYSGSVSALGSGDGHEGEGKIYNGSAHPSSFRDVSAHTWYAAQWSPSLSDRSNGKVEKDYWYNSQGKPSINYEGRYCYLWTKNFGSRMQGWSAFLSGLYGYGWGAHDTWSYLNVYNEDADSDDGIDKITSEEKINATWEDTLEYPCSYQVGYMKNFFSSLEWWELIPRFGNTRFFKPDKGVLSYTASKAGNGEMVIYFYSFSDTSVGEKPNASGKAGVATGKIRGLEPGKEYSFKWFNPITGEFSEEGHFTASSFGTYKIGSKQWSGKDICTDMVFYMYS